MSESRDPEKMRELLSRHFEKARTVSAAVISGLRELGTPYHLAHGLLDYAQCLMRQGDDEAAAAAIEEARDIAGLLRCQPLLDWAADLMSAAPRVRA